MSRLRNRLEAAVVLATALLFVASCGYNFAGTGSRMPEDVKTLSFGPILNSTREVGLEKVVREALEDEISARGRLEVVPIGQGDVVLAGTVAGYETRPAALNERGEALQYTSTLSLVLDLRRRTNGKLLWQTQRYRAEEDFSAVPGVVVTSSSRFQKQTLNSQDLALFTDIQLSEGQRREANERLVENAAREIYNQMMEDF